MPGPPGRRGARLPGAVPACRARCPLAGRGARLPGAVPAWRARCPLAGRGARLAGRDPGGWADVPRSGLSAAANQTIASCRRPRGDLVQLWLGPRLCSPRLPAVPTISAECAVCGVGVPALWNACPSAGITSRRVGSGSIQRAPCPTCGNTEPRGGVARPAKARPPAGHPTARRTATAATDEAGCPRRSRRNPPHPFQDLRRRGRPVQARRPGRRRPPAGGEGLPGGRR